MKQLIEFAIAKDRDFLYQGALYGTLFVTPENRKQCLDFLLDSYEGELLWIRHKGKTIYQTPLGSRYLNTIGSSAKGYFPGVSSHVPKCYQRTATNDRNTLASQASQGSVLMTQSFVLSNMTLITWLKDLLGSLVNLFQK